MGSKNVNFVNYEKSEFSENWDFENVNFLKNDNFESDLMILPPTWNPDFKIVMFNKFKILLSEIKIRKFKVNFISRFQPEHWIGRTRFLKTLGNQRTAKRNHFGRFGQSWKFRTQTSFIWHKAIIFYPLNK